MGLREYQRPAPSEIDRRLGLVLIELDVHLCRTAERISRYRAAGAGDSLRVLLHVANRQLDARFELMQKIERAAP